MRFTISLLYLYTVGVLAQPLALETNVVIATPVVKTTPAGITSSFTSVAEQGNAIVKGIAAQSKGAKALEGAAVLGGGLLVARQLYHYGADQKKETPRKEDTPEGVESAIPAAHAHNRVLENRDPESDEQNRTPPLEDIRVTTKIPLEDFNNEEDSMSRAGQVWDGAKYVGNEAIGRLSNAEEHQQTEQLAAAQEGLEEQPEHHPMAVEEEQEIETLLAAPKEDEQQQLETLSAYDLIMRAEMRLKDAKATLKELFTSHKSLNNKSTTTST